MKIVISSGHGKHIRGASGYIDEVDEARLVVEEVAVQLRRIGVEAVTYHDNVSTSQNENLNRIVDFHNSQSRDIDVSVHFNAYETTSKPMGSEVLWVTQSELATQVVNAICTTSGLTNRGPKKRSDLFFLNNTAKPSILIETCFVDSSADVDIYRRQYSNICDAIALSLAGQNAVVPPPEAERPPARPPVVPPAEGHQTVKKGDNNQDVVVLQKALGVLEADGDFGSITDTWVRAFQSACGLGADGVVGDKTWGEVDALQARVGAAPPLLSKQAHDLIYTMAQTSEIADYSWPDRGIPPPGYIAGMALSFATAFVWAESGQDAAKAMSQQLGSPDTDVLAWYKAELGAAGCSSLQWDDRLRSLFTLMIGLGPRESSGRYCEGRDMSATNVSSDTCEAGLFQTSWNIRSSHTSIGPLLEEFWQAPVGFLAEFKDGVSPTANNLNSYGSGDGIQYQWLSRFCPVFHVFVTGVGLRSLRQHWGPVNRREVTIRREAHKLLQDVQALVEDEA